MRYWINETCFEPEFNLAAEEYLFTSAGQEPTLILWQNRPSVIIGRNQNTSAEISSRYAEENGIRVVRRNTGGGAVYHDLGNLNYSFILPDESSAAGFRSLSEPLAQVLRAIGVPVEITGRNDLTLYGKKISGTAQYRRDTHILHHGTLLHSVDLDRMTRVLNVDAEKIESKGIDSIRSRVMNIREHLPNSMSIRQLEDAIVQGFSLICSMTPFSLSAGEQKTVERLVEDKYCTWEWNYGQSPNAAFYKKVKLSCGTIQAYWDERAGCMTHVMLKGDYLFMEDPRVLENALEGIRHQASIVREVLLAPCFSGMFPNTSADELLSCFF